MKTDWVGKCLVGIIFLVGVGYATLGRGNVLQTTSLSKEEASNLFGARTPQFQTYTAYWDRYCVEIEECLDDSCEGGEFTCETHVVRNTRTEGQFSNLSVCKVQSDSADCYCEENQSRWTCSNVFAGCRWDEDEEECVEDVGWGLQLAPQTCQSACMPIFFP